MNKQDRIIDKINNNKEIQVNLTKLYSSNSEDFYRAAIRYIKAIKEGRMICSINSVSSSGMSRTIKFLECSKGQTSFSYYNFYLLFISLGFSRVKESEYFRINGCGMDMIFHTNYTIIHNFKTLGFISKKQCETLAQMTPQVI